MVWIEPHLFIHPACHLLPPYIPLRIAVMKIERGMEVVNRRRYDGRMQIHQRTSLKISSIATITEQEFLEIGSQADEQTSHLLCKLPLLLVSPVNILM